MASWRNSYKSPVNLKQLFLWERLKNKKKGNSLFLTVDFKKKVSSSLLVTDKEQLLANQCTVEC